MKIPIICYKFPPYYSGYGKQLKTVLEKIFQIDNTKKFIILTAFGENYEGENYLVKSFNLNMADSPKKNIYLFSYKVFKWMVFNKQNISLVHCIKAGPEAVAAKLSAYLLGIPVIIKIAQDELSEIELKNKNFINKFRIKIRHSFLLKSTNFISISKDIEKMLNQKIKKKSRVFYIPNGVDTTKYNHSNLITKKDSLKFLYVGAINKRKGIYDLLNSLKTLHVSENIKFIFCGPILEDDDFFNKVKEINDMENNVLIEYLGEVDNVNKYMMSSDIFLLLSYSEGLPNVLLEAASSGLPIVTTDIPGSRDLVENDVNGKKIKLNSDVEIKNSITFFINNKNKINDMGKKSRELAEKNYDVSIIAKKYIELYEKLSKNE